MEFFVLFLRVSKVIGFLLTIAVLCINMYFAIVYIDEYIHYWALYLLVAIVFFMYMMFVAYLVSNIYIFSIFNS